jgi:hypothetical protein
MRRFLMLGFATAGLLLGTFGAVKAATRSNAPIEDGTRDYWRTAQTLMQEQRQLLSRVEQAMPQPKVQRLHMLRNQVLLHTTSVNRFLKSNHPDPKTACTPLPETGELPGTDAASPEQIRVYCSLFSSTRDLTVLRSRLDRQAKLLTNPGGFSKDPVQSVIKQRSKQPAKTKPLTLSTSSKEILSQVQVSRRRLVQMEKAFPEKMRISKSRQNSAQLVRKPKRFLDRVSVKRIEI